MSGRAKVVTVGIGGEIRCLCVDYNALCTVEELTGVDLMIGNASMTLRVLRSLVYGALIEGARRSRGKQDFTPEDVGDWMEGELDDGGKLVDRVLALLPEAMPEKKAGEDDPQTVQQETTRPALATG